MTVVIYLNFQGFLPEFSTWTVQLYT